MTPQERKVMELAFEALKENQHLVADNERHAYVMEYNSIIEKCEEALAEPEQEPEFIKHEVESAEDWSEWVCPNPHKYLMKCCDCGLVHEAEFGVVRYKSETEREDCEPVNDPNLQAVFRMRRSEQWSPEDTAHRAGGLPMAQPEQEPVAWIHNFIDGGISIGKRPADLNRHPDRWTALYKEPKPCPTCEALARTVMLDQTSHDTTPPQRTWVGLTYEDIERIKLLTFEKEINTNGEEQEAVNLDQLIRAAEQLCKEKNYE